MLRRALHDLPAPPLPCTSTPSSGAALEELGSASALAWPRARLEPGGPPEAAARTRSIAPEPMVRVVAVQGPPVGGLTVYDQLEINIAPVDTHITFGRSYLRIDPSYDRFYPPRGVERAQTSTSCSSATSSPSRRRPSSRARLAAVHYCWSLPPMRGRPRHARPRARRRLPPVSQQAPPCLLLSPLPQQTTAALRRVRPSTTHTRPCVVL